MRWLFLDRIDELVPGESARAVKTFHPDEPFFEDHFPRFPVVPGVLLLEALAQLSGKLVGFTVRRERGDWPFPILSMMERVKFRRFVRPGERVELHTQIRDLREEMAAVRVRARVGGRVTTQADQLFVYNAVPLQEPGHSEELERVEFTVLRHLWADCPDDLPTLPLSEIPYDLRPVPKPAKKGDSS